MILIIIIISIIIIIIIISVSKCKDLELEITWLWKMGTEMIPVFIGALGVIKKGLEKYIDKILGTVSISELQKSPVLLWELLIFRKVVSITLTFWYLRSMVSTRCFRD